MLGEKAVKRRVRTDQLVLVRKAVQLRRFVQVRLSADAERCLQVAGEAVELRDRDREDAHRDRHRRPVPVDRAQASAASNGVRRRSMYRLSTRSEVRSRSFQMTNGTW